MSLLNTKRKTQVQCAKKQ